MTIEDIDAIADALVRAGLSPTRLVARFELTLTPTLGRQQAQRGRAEAELDIAGEVTAARPSLAGFVPDLVAAVNAVDTPSLSPGEWVSSTSWRVGGASYDTGPGLVPLVAELSLARVAPRAKTAP